MERYLTTKEVADKMQVSPSTVYLWVKKGDLPAHKVGRTVRFRDDEVTYFMGGEMNGHRSAAPRQRRARRTRTVTPARGGAWSREEAIEVIESAFRSLLSGE